MKKPTDERDLKCLRIFINEAPQRIEELTARLNDVYQHLLILEDYGVIYPVFYIFLILIGTCF